MSIIIHALVSFLCAILSTVVYTSRKLVLLLSVQFYYLKSINGIINQIPAWIIYLERQSLQQHWAAFNNLFWKQLIAKWSLNVTVSLMVIWHLISTVRKPKDLRLAITNINENQFSKIYQRPSFRSNFFFVLCLPSDNLEIEKSQTFILLHVLNILDVLEVSQFLELAKGHSLTFIEIVKGLYLPN